MASIGQKFIEAIDTIYWIINQFIFEEFMKNLDTEIINDEHSCRICNTYFASADEYMEHEAVHFTTSPDDN